MTIADPRLVEAAVKLVDRLLETESHRPVVLGICGAQGSGKSTLAEDLASAFDKRGIANATLSLDDLYLTRAERQRLAEEVHPLLLTRGVPGTHDLALGHEVLDELERGDGALLPRFDKARDDREPLERWERGPDNCEVLIFEGWCVGARPQPPSELDTPINSLEKSEDADATWRRYVNDALAGPYQKLFDRIDALLLIAAPGFETVFNWRKQQEDLLRSRRAASGADGARIMHDTQLARFLQHYERLTRYILTEMPDRADVVIQLDADRNVRNVA